MDRIDTDQSARRRARRARGPRAALESALFPLLAFGPAAVAIWATRPAPGAPPGTVALETSLPLFGAILGSFYVLVAALERLLPYRPAWNRSQGDTRTDAAHLALTGPLTNQLAQASVNALALVAVSRRPPLLDGGPWPSSWPIVLQLVLAVAIAELGHYAFHRLSHESPLVWRVHAVHHSAPRLYWLNATRFHPLDLFALIFLQTLPLLLLGIPSRVFFLYSVCAGCYGQLQHANVRFPRDFWSLVFSSPELHRWHHSTDPDEGNTNYGAILIVWDLVFGTYFRPRHREFAGPVGNGLTGFPAGYLRQLTVPFQWTWRADDRSAGT